MTRRCPYFFVTFVASFAPATQFVWLYDRTQVTCQRFHMYARHDVTENVTLVAKLITSFPAYGSLVCGIPWPTFRPHRAPLPTPGVVLPFTVLHGVQGSHATDAK
jgi:hypothetical protein